MGVVMAGWGEGRRFQEWIASAGTSAAQGIIAQGPAQDVALRFPGSLE